MTMMFDGTLRVHTVTWRNGQFNAGLLKSPIGDFEVSDKALEQFEPGDYTGRFLVEQIEQKGRRTQRGYMFFMYARIAQDGFLIDTENQVDQTGTPEPGVALPDDLADQASKFNEPAQTPNVTSKPAPIAVQVQGDQEESDKTLFGLELYALFAARSELALDATVDRDLFRRQRERLKAEGYRFQSKTQTWSVVGAA